MSREYHTAGLRGHFAAFFFGGYFHSLKATSTSSSHFVSGLYSGGVPIVGQSPPPSECSFQGILHSGDTDRNSSASGASGNGH